MRTISISRSIITFWEDLVFLEAALLATDQTKPLAAPVTEALEEFTATLKTDLDTRRGLLQCSARGSVADAELDTGLRGLFSAVLHLVKQDRKRPEFTTLFSTHIGNVVRHGLRRQLDIAEQLRAKLSLSIYPDALRDEQQALLEPLVAKGRAALEDQHKAELSRVAGRLDARAWKDEANAVRLSVYGELLTMASKAGRKKEWAEAFFLRRTEGVEAGEAGERDADGGESDEPDLPEG